MKIDRFKRLGAWRTRDVAAAGLAAALMTATLPAFAGAQGGTQAKKPNIVFIMGDDIGFMQPSIYHRGIMVGETPNIDRIGNEGAIYMDYLAMQSCTSGRMRSSRGCIRFALA